MLPIQKKLIKYNHSSRNGQKVQYIVIHDTGNPRKGANAMAHYRYFNGGNRNASAHYFVDDREILQLVEDKHAAWHCGDGRGRYGITNQNSIGIEICINSDGDYERAVENTVQLTKHLMKKHGIPLGQVVRHFDASRKNCPGTMSANNWSKWFVFKEKLKIEEEAEMIEKAVVINSYVDFPVAEVLANSIEAPIYLRSIKHKAKKVYVIGGELEGIEGEEIIHLSGRDRFETAARVKAYMESRNQPETLDIDSAIEQLVGKGIIQSPDYWLHNARKGKTVKGDYVEILLKRIASQI